MIDEHERILVLFSYLTAHIDTNDELGKTLLNTNWIISLEEEGKSLMLHYLKVLCRNALLSLNYDVVYIYV